MDGTILLCLPTHPSSGENSDQDQRGSSRRGNNHLSPVAEEILVPLASPDVMRDPPLAPMQMGSPVTMPDRQRHALLDGPGDSPVDGMEAEWHTLQIKSFSEATIRTILSATHDSSGKVYNSRWESFTSWVVKGVRIPLAPL